MHTYLRSFTYFRALSILCIVAGHTFLLVGIPLHSSSHYLIANLIINGTVLFVFISGFLFHHVYYDQFSFIPFMKKKVLYVFTPYLIFSATMIVLQLYVYKTPPFPDYFFRAPTYSLFNNHIRPFLLYLWTGRILGAYWYIPFIMIIYTASPLCVWYARRPLNLQLFILIALFIISNAVHRPMHNLSVAQSVIYYVPVYLLGIIASEYRKNIYALLKQREFLLLLLVLAFAIAQFHCQGYHDETGQWIGRYGSYIKPALQRGSFDLQMFQKVTLCFLLMVFLHRFENTHWKPLNLLASLSFGIYFIHNVLIYAINRYTFGKLIPYSGLPLWLALTIVITLASMGIALLFRHLFGKYSRLICGC